MTFINPPKEEDLFRYEGDDGYESGGLIYFRFAGKELVALIRERSVFDKYRKDGSTLAEYANSDVSHEVYGAGLVLEKKIPKRHAAGTSETRISNQPDEAIARGERATRVFRELGHRVVSAGGRHVEIDGESFYITDVPGKIQREHPSEWAAAELEHRRVMGSEE
jgi:hypothetical protein